MIQRYDFSVSHEPLKAENGDWCKAEDVIPLLCQSDLYKAALDLTIENNDNCINQLSLLKNQLKNALVILLRDCCLDEDCKYYGKPNCSSDGKKCKKQWKKYLNKEGGKV